MEPLHKQDCLISSIDINGENRQSKILGPAAYQLHCTLPMQDIRDSDV